MGEHLFRKSCQKNGWYYGWFYGPDGKRVTRSLRTADRRIARDRLRQFEREAHASGGAASNAAPHTVEDTVRFIVEVGCSDRAEGTLEMYAKKGGHLVRVFGDQQVHALSLDKVQDYINQRLGEGAARETVRKELSTLRVALETAKARKLYVGDPRSIFPPFRVTYRPRERHLSVEEFGKLLAVLDAKRRRWIMVAVYSGARRSEVEALRWDTHVNLETGWLVLPGTKTAKARRSVPILQPLADELASDPSKKGFVVEAWANVGRDLRIACAHAGVARVSPNDLRRTFASWMKQQGEDSAVVAKLLGHASTRMVDLVYGRLNDENLRRAVAKLPSVAVPSVGSTSEAALGRLVGEEGLLGTGAPPVVAENLPHENQKARQISRSGGPRWCSSSEGVPGAGIEPATRGFSVPCSTD
ncbi:integrase family protein [Anaeromyxobacter dehalogenans 2CP-1]|uniref:Integrase family protein n=1 Tax=Anaeromyxobacter dehalogenans (strain ATCC BAA-258 / DSM 21875 / 2CP-1) TaxID=455488 RepID=B8J6Z7_ANAD2|nr:integrase family protein [Anaeromyxobacter dehalogenans 2CP-1]